MSSSIAPASRGRLRSGDIPTDRARDGRIERSDQFLFAIHDQIVGSLVLTFRIVRLFRPGTTHSRHATHPRPARCGSRNTGRRTGAGGLARYSRDGSAGPTAPRITAGAPE